MTQLLCQDYLTGDHHFQSSRSRRSSSLEALFDNEHENMYWKVRDELVPTSFDRRRRTGFVGSVTIENEHALSIVSNARQMSIP